MKQTFVVDIECEGENFESIYNDGILKWAKIQNCQLKQINSCTLTNFRVLPPVEQSVERPILQDEMINLLKRASDSLNYYCAEINGDMNDGLAMEIDKYIRENTRRT